MWYNIEEKLPNHLDVIKIKLKNDIICETCVFHHLRTSLQKLKEIGATDEFIEERIKEHGEYEVTHWRYDNEKKINVRTTVNYNNIIEWLLIRHFDTKK